MAKLWSTLLGRSRVEEISRYNWDQYTADLSLAYNGSRYILSSGSAGFAKSEDIENSFSGYINGFYKSNGIVFAITLARLMLFTEGRFCWWNIGDNGEDGKPAGRQGLEVLERPWPNAGTGELLARAEQDVTLGGNFFAAREPDRVRRLRPDWVTIVLTAPPAEATQSDVAGYWYHPGRVYSNAGEPAPGDDVYLPDEVCHWSPIPDPDAQYRGMSWLTPVVREIQGDKAAIEHKLNFFANGATLGAIISAKENLTPTQFAEWKANIESQTTGVDNAYRSLFFASPVDTSVRSVDMRQLDFKVTQGAGETRLCAAGGVPPIIVGLSEGLASATYSNYGMARRKFGDHWARPQWKSISVALSNVVDAPEGDVRLGVNVKDIAFLREDRKDQAEITKTQILALEAGIRAGYKSDALVEAVVADDVSLLLGQHTGLTSVQLLPPGAKDTDGDGSVDVTAADDAAADEYQQALQMARSEPLEWDLARARNYYGQGVGERIGAGLKGGGRFRKLSDRIAAALSEWLDGDGDDDPLDEFNREQVRKAAVELGLTPRRGASADEIKLQLLTDARRRFKEVRKADRDAAEAKDASARFRLKAGQVASVYQESDGRVSLYEDNDGKRGKRVVTVADLAGLEAWADEHGHQDVAEWSRTERGDLESKAVSRQAEIDKARATADLLAEVDELLASGASERALRSRITARAKAAKSPEALRDELLANVDDPDALRGVVDRAEREAGLEPIGSAGETARFDPKLHESLGGSIDTGKPVLISRRGHRWNGKVLGRAGVLESEPDEGGAAPVKAVGEGPRKIAKASPGPRKAAKPGAAPALDSLKAIGDPEAIRDELDLLKLPELKDLLGSAGLLKTGRKRELVDRLVEHLRGTPEGEVAGSSVRRVGRDISGEVDFDGLPPEYDRVTNTDPALREILRTQGFDGPPQVVTRSQFDAAVKRGEVRETWRGIARSPFSDLTPEQMAETFRTGDLHAGVGINGHGTYVAARQADAQYYGPTLLRVGLRRDARVISADDLDAEMDAYFAEADRASYTRFLIGREEQLLQDLAKAKTPRARANIRRQFRAEIHHQDRDRKNAIQRDPGRFAALRGYDAIDIPRKRSPDLHAELIILNRTAVIVEEAP